MSEGEDLNDRISKLEATIEQLKAELAWVRVMLSGKAPVDTAEKTSPPWVLILIGSVTPVAVAVLTTQPWK